jgi:peptidoglycan/xylan/chitin deacetylase (PgdA/CDA1 family)
LERILITLAMMLLIVQIPVSYGEGHAGGKIAPCNCVAFRLDDVQDYYLNQAQMEVIRTFEKKNASLTVGVIGNFIGDDIVLVDFLKKRIANNNALEVANHGWDHEDFTLFDRDQQSDLLSRSNEKIFEELGVVPRVFITPYNQMNNDTLAAMAENSIHVVSANVTEDHPPFVRNMTGGADVSAIYHLPATAKTGDLNKDNTQWLGVKHGETLSAVKASMEEHGYALVMMHPQEFSARDGLNFQNRVDGEQMAELELLLDAMADEGYTIVTVSQLASYSAIPEFGGFLYAALALPVAAIIAYTRKLKIRI